MLHLMLHDDWEINGDGTGDPNALMFSPARRLLDICDKYGARYTFFAEVMQQFAMRESRHRFHRRCAREWEELLRDAVRRGHDVQLHVHPQWQGARFVEGKWLLDHSKWNIASLGSEEVSRLITKGKAYLESLLQPVCPAYEVVAFRAGGWMAQPSGGIIGALERAEILADCSVVPGKRHTFKECGTIDYSRAFHSLLPWWVHDQDVSLAATGRRAVMELPTYAEEFQVPLPIYLLKSNIWSIPHYFDIYRWRREKQSAKEFIPTTLGSVKFFGRRSTYCSFGYMDYRSLLRMVYRAVRLAELDDIVDPPLVMLTHSKSFFSFSNFEKLLERLSADPQIYFSRTREFVRELHSGAVAGLPLSARTVGEPRGRSGPFDPSRPIDVGDPA